MNVLFSPVVLAEPDELPKNVLKFPSVLASPESFPTKVLDPAVVL